MSRTVPAAVLTEAQKASNQPRFLVTLSLTGTTVRLCDGEKNIDFPSTAGNTYTGWGMSFTDVKTALTGEISRVVLRLDNTEKAFSSYVQNYDFFDRVCTIEKIFYNLLSNSSYKLTVFSGLMQNPSTNEGYVEIPIIGRFQKLQKPFGRMYQNHCPWTFKSNQCAYAGVETSCDKLLSTCASYSNIANFGGFTQIPNEEFE